MRTFTGDDIINCFKELDKRLPPDSGRVALFRRPRLLRLPLGFGARRRKAATTHRPGRTRERRAAGRLGCYH